MSRPAAPHTHPGAVPTGTDRAPWILPVTVLLAVFAALAVGAAGLTGYGWWHNTRDGRMIAAAGRDAALRDARQVAVNLTTINSTDQNTIKEGLARWEQSSTGPQLDQFRAQFDSMVQTFERARTTTTSEVKDAALTEFDGAAGTAKAIVAVDVTVAPSQDQPTTKSQLYQLALQRTDDGWKATAAGAVAGRS